MPRPFTFSIDRGGTFTDVYCEYTDPETGVTIPHVLKLLSEDPDNYPDAPREGIRRLLERCTGEAHPRSEPLDTSRIEFIRMGTTVATNALLERKGSRCALVISNGFRDVLHIGDQSRPDIFDLRVRVPDVLYDPTLTVEVDERVVPCQPLASSPKGKKMMVLAAGHDGGGSGGEGDTGRPSGPEPAESLALALGVPFLGAGDDGGNGSGGDGKLPEPGTVVTAVTGESFFVVRPPDLAAVRTQLQNLREAGIDSIAVCLMHSYAFRRHEEAVGRLALELGFEEVSLSHAVSPMRKVVGRGLTTCVCAYLNPVLKRYVTGFRAGFKGKLRGELPRVSFMKSDGGLTAVDRFAGHRAILSGPAGGVVGYAQTSPPGRAVIGFDMGGTSTDVSRYGGEGELDIVHETTTAGVKIKAPQLSIDTVAAGGGSRLFFRSGIFVVGPESAGAHPGPACYRKGGPLTVTDANLVLGRIVPQFFPKIFGPKENEPLGVEAARAKFRELAREINAHRRAEWEEEEAKLQAKGQGQAGKASSSASASASASSSSSFKEMSLDEIAHGYLRVANEAMARPVRNITLAKGFDVRQHAINCFGGAGPQHGCAVARTLGISDVYVNRYSGILSAYGLCLAEVVHEEQEPSAMTYLRPGRGEESEQRRAAQVEEIATAFSRLEGKCAGALAQDGVDKSAIRYQRFLNMRFEGTDCALMVAEQTKATSEGSAAAGGFGKSYDFAAAFVRRYERQFGFSLDAATRIIVDDIRIRATTAGGAAAAGKGNGAAAEKKEDEGEEEERSGRRRLSPDEIAALRQASGRADGGGVSSLKPVALTSAYFEPGGRRDDTPCYRVSSLLPGDAIRGPAILLQPTSTVVVEPGCVANFTEYGDLHIEVGEAGAKAAEAAATAADAMDVDTDAKEKGKSGGGGGGGEESVDTILLSIFSHRFMGIAEQMGNVLRNISVSVNMKERLDFSCALFGPRGGLIANAPHIPVHLGAMQEAVRYQIDYWCGRGITDPNGPLGDGNRGGLSRGDVLLSNHPRAGGSHLPDITVITPVFGEAKEGKKDKVVFFVASRGHHADVGGITPGSMPPFSKSLADEGAAIRAFKIVDAGKAEAEGKESPEFDEVGIRALLEAPGAIAGNSGTRNLRENLSDLRAQIAANARGINLVGGLIREYGLKTVHAYMGHIVRNARLAVSNMLYEFSLASLEAEEAEDGERPGKKRKMSKPSKTKVAAPSMTTTHIAEDYLDDGSPIRLSVTIDRSGGPRETTAVFDFEGTGPQVYGNLNAPPAVTYSSVIYSLRSMVGHDIPLNQGCLAPIEFKVPQGCLLNPDETAAIVGGNVLTSQRVVDVVLKAFEACAASQGCMNNLTFGDDSFGFYETIAGGAGAGPSWHGRSGVHTHCTNTRITDPEIMEQRYPVMLREFGIREGSGGAGTFKGGDGCVRRFVFLRPLTVGILSERRTLRPYGMLGGAPGMRGRNLLVKRVEDDMAGGGGEEERKQAEASAKVLTVNIGGKNTVMVAAGDELVLLTPGGGGWGKK